MTEPLDDVARALGQLQVDFQRARNRTRLIIVVLVLALAAMVVANARQSSTNSSLTCRAQARVPYDTIRDRRDNLIAEGLVAAAQNDKARLAAITIAVDRVTAKIEHGPTLPDLYDRAGC